MASVMRRCVYRVLVVKSERRPLRIPTLRWDDNIKVDMKCIGLKNVDWIDLTQDRDNQWAVLNAVMDITVP